LLGLGNEDCRNRELQQVIKALPPFIRFINGALAQSNLSTFIMMESLCEEAPVEISEPMKRRRISHA
jgi:hypothetical protein